MIHLKRYGMLSENMLCWVPYNNKLFLTVLDVEKSKIKTLGDSICWSPPPVSQTSVFSLCLPMIEQELSEVPFFRVLIPFTSASPSRHNQFSKVSSPHTITLGIRISTYESRGTQIFSPQHKLHIAFKCIELYDIIQNYMISTI